MHERGNQRIWAGPLGRALGMLTLKSSENINNFTETGKAEMSSQLQVDPGYYHDV